MDGGEQPFVLYAGRARVAAISLSVIMMSRMPSPRAMEAPMLRAMVVKWFESVCTSPSPSRLRDAGPNLGGGPLVFVVPAHGGVLHTARRWCDGSD